MIEIVSNTRIFTPKIVFSSPFQCEKRMSRFFSIWFSQIFEVQKLIRTPFFNLILTTSITLSSLKNVLHIHQAKKSNQLSDFYACLQLASNKFRWSYGEKTNCRAEKQQNKTYKKSNDVKLKISTINTGTTLLTYELEGLWPLYTNWNI